MWGRRLKSKSFEAGRFGLAQLTEGLVVFRIIQQIMQIMQIMQSNLYLRQNEYNHFIHTFISQIFMKHPCPQKL